MKKTFAFIALLLMLNFYSQAQSFAINTAGTAAHASAMLDVTSTTKGVLIPRLTTAQRTAIASPGKGLLVYDSTLKTFYFHDGINWQQINADSNNLWRKNGTNIYNSNAGNVGIGISSPKSLLNVRGGAVLFDSTIGSTPMSGAGTRMMWIPAKGAFRAGMVTGALWDDAKIGPYSFASGVDNQASGYYSTALGYNTTAMGSFSTALGQYCWARSQGSVVYGFWNFTDGNNSIAGGSSCQTIGDNSAALGEWATSKANGSFAFGSVVISKSPSGTVVGAFNDTTSAANLTLFDPLNRIFEIGNGTSITNYSNAMTVLFNGNVGIGTTTPAFMLTVKKDINLDNGDANAGTTTNALKFGGNGTGEAIGSNRTTGVNQWGLDFYTAFANRMSIANNGNVGIGTTLPTSKLDVNGQITIDQKNFGGYAGLLVKGNSSVSNYPNIGFSTQNTSGNDIISAIIGGNITNNTAGSEAIDLSFYTSTSGQSGLAQRMVIKDNGNVGIGETAPIAPLNFTSAVLGNRISLWGNGATHYGMGIQAFLMQLYTQDINGNIAFGYGSSGAFTETMRIKGNGNVGIGTSSPTAMLSVNGTANNSTGNWTVFSDERIKTITDDFTDGLTVIKKIQPVKFRYNDNAPFKSDEEQIGIVAQDLEKIAPYMVSQKPYKEFNDLREVNNQAYVFLLINAVKEQQVQIEAQKKENDGQKQRIDDLEKIVKELSRKANQ